MIQEFSDESKIGHLEDEALKRKQRLEEMRTKRKQASESHEKFDQMVQNKIALPKPKFRSYNPTDENLKEKVLPKVRPEDVKSQLTDELDKAKSNESLVEDIDLTKLAPRKIDWDLKRNIAKKLDKLERKTQIAIAELIRERLKSSGTVEDLDKATEDLESAEIKNSELEANDDDDDDDTE